MLNDYLAENSFTMTRSHLHPRKRLRSNNSNQTKVPILFVKLRIGSGSETIIVQALVDSGASATVVNKATAKSLAKQKVPATVWTTAAGIFSTEYSTELVFSLPELNPTAEIKINAHVVDSAGNYNIILGRDLLSEIGLDVLFSDESVQRW